MPLDHTRFPAGPIASSRIVNAVDRYRVPLDVVNRFIFTHSLRRLIRSAGIGEGKETTATLQYGPLYRLDLRASQSISRLNLDLLKFSFDRIREDGTTKIKVGAIIETDVIPRGVLVEWPSWLGIESRKPWSEAKGFNLCLALITQTHAYFLEHHDEGSWAAAPMVIELDSGRILQAALTREGFISHVGMENGWIPSQDAELEAIEAIRHLAMISTFFGQMHRLADGEPVLTEVPASHRLDRGKRIAIPRYHMVTVDLSEERRKKLVKQIVREQKQRAKSREHGVVGHWTHYHCDEACDHVWSNIVEDDPKRQHCHKCGGRRTRRDPYRRGDPTLGTVEKLIRVTDTRRT